MRPVFSLLFSKSKIRYISVHSSNQQISARCLFCGLHSFFVLPDIQDRMVSYMHLSQKNSTKYSTYSTTVIQKTFCNTLFCIYMHNYTLFSLCIYIYVHTNLYAHTHIFICIFYIHMHIIHLLYIHLYIGSQSLIHIYYTL